MRENFDELSVVKNELLKRFELTVDGFVAFIDYEERPNVIRLIHTESPEELAGRGVATALIEKTLQYILAHHYQLVPLCPLVFAYIKRHQEWVEIVKEEYKDKFN